MTTDCNNICFHLNQEEGRAGHDQYCLRGGGGGGGGGGAGGGGGGEGGGGDELDGEVHDHQLQVVPPDLWLLQVQLGGGHSLAREDTNC